MSKVNSRERLERLRMDLQVRLETAQELADALVTYLSNTQVPLLEWPTEDFICSACEANPVDRKGVHICDQCAKRPHNGKPSAILWQNGRNVVEGP